MGDGDDACPRYFPSFVEIVDLYHISLTIAAVLPSRERECCRACTAGDACPAQQEHGDFHARRERNRAWNYRAPFLSLPTDPTEPTGQGEGARILHIATPSLLG